MGFSRKRKAGADKWVCILAENKCLFPIRSRRTFKSSPVKLVSGDKGPWHSTLLLRCLEYT